MRRILTVLFALMAIVITARAATEVTVGNFVYKGPYTFDNENCYNIEKLSDAGKTVTGQLVVPGYVVVSGTRYRVRNINGLSNSNGAQFSSVKIEYGVQRITRETFRDCTRLTTVSLPSSIEDIGQMTFSGCSNLKYLFYAGEGTMDVQEYTFEYTPSTKYLYTATNRGKSVLKANSTWTSAFSTIQCDPRVAYDFSINGIAYVIKKGIPYNYSSCSVAIVGGNPSNNGTVTLNQNINSGLTNTPGSYPIREVVDSAFCGNANVKTVANHLFCGHKIGRDAFRNCTNLTSVDIAADSIYPYAFYGCTALNSITLHAPNDGGGPNGVHYIGNYAFGCVGATSVTLPSSLEVSGAAPFFHCPNLTSISVNSSNANFSSYQGCLYNKDYSRLYQIPEGLTSVSFHPNLQYALNYCGSYTKCALLSFPYGMKGVNSYAFSNMPNLKQVCIPSSFTSMNSTAFAGSTGITEIELNKVTPPSSDFFPALTKSDVKLYIPYDGYEAYSTNSIWGNYNIQNGNGDWNECYDFADVNYYTVTSSNEVCLVRPSNSTTVIIPNTVTRNGKSYKVTAIGPYAFCDGPTSNFTVTVSSGTNLATVRDYAFYSNTHLKSFPFESIARIDERAFNGTTGLTAEVKLTNCSTIGIYAFNKCGLAKLVTSAALTSIGTNAFRECTNLSEVNLSSSKNLTEIPTYCFADCISLDNFYGQSTDFNITTIGDGAFYRTHLSSFPWNKKIARIGVSAFAETQFEGELDLKVCGENSFYLDDMAFSNVNKVTSFVLPATTTFVGNASMSTQGEDWYKNAREYEGYPDYSSKVRSYLNLKSVTCYATTPPAIGTGNPWFAKHQEFQTLYVPKGSITAYRAAAYWMRFNGAVAIQITETGDVNGDGVVSGADVTALYNVLLDGATAEGDADVNGDGFVNGSDVTALYNILLGS